MKRYILRRLLIIIPTMFAIMALSFLIGRSTPGDLVTALTSMSDPDRSSATTREKALRDYKRISSELGLDMPIFYMSLTSIAYPDTLYRIVKLNERKALDRLIAEYGNWELISEYFQSLVAMEDQAFALQAPDGAKREFDSVKQAFTTLRETPEKELIAYQINLIDSVADKYPAEMAGIKVGMTDLKARWERVQTETSTWKLYVPTLHFYGFKNQFHHWLVNFFSLDFGQSYRDNRPVRTKIAEALPWSIFMGLVSFAIAYLVAIPLGLYCVRHRNAWQDRTVTTLLFLLYSVPSFVTAMLVMTFFCNPEFFYIFPTNGVASDGAENWSFWERMLDYAYHLTLPTLVSSYTGVAFLSRQMRVAMLDNIDRDYIRTARAKGVSERKVIWRHALRNSILPIITHFASLLPRIIGGSVILETIFAIPGVGRLAIQATFSYDHPVLLALLTLGSILTLLGILMSDILYAVADPRISFNKK